MSIRKATRSISKLRSRVKSRSKSRTVNKRRIRVYRPTFIEKRLGLLLTKLGIHHRAQYQIKRSNGRSYYADFYLIDANLVLEADGNAYHGSKIQIRRDEKREQEIHLLGYSILRFTGSEIVNYIDMVEQKILEVLEVERLVSISNPL